MSWSSLLKPYIEISASDSLLQRVVAELIKATDFEF